MDNDDYVQLKRRFVDVSKEPSSAWSRSILGRATGETWETLAPASSPPPHERSAVVVLAPSGVGKTAELTAQTARLNAAGVTAFFMRAVDVAARGVAGALTASSAFRAWLASPARAVFFIDAVDESRLEGHDLEQIMSRFAQDVDPPTKLVQLVLSSRNDIWTKADERQVVGALKLPADNPPVRIVRLEPLSRDDVTFYARANGVLDTDAFIAALVDEEIEFLFDLRPPDARILVDYWKRHGSFGSWSEMLQASIEASVRNENRRHALQQQFTLEEALRGVSRLAAATILGKRPLISLPGRAYPEEVSSDRLFSDKRPGGTSQLLSMGLFAQKGHHSVQLPQGAPSHFLAASWLGERARNGWDLRALEEVLFVRPFGEPDAIVPPSRSQVLGWVAGAVPGIRDRLIRELPHVLLFEGDPSRISRGECTAALRAVVANIKSGLHDAHPTRGTLRQVAKHDIGDAVLRLLRECAGVPNAQRMLLEIAAIGRYQGVVPHALTLALSPGVNDVLGAPAIRVVAASGSRQDRERLLPLATHTSQWMRLALVEGLAPDILNGPALVQLTLTITDHHVANQLGRALTKATLAELDAILLGLQPLLPSSVVDSGTDARLELALKLTVVRLTRGGRDRPPWMTGLLLLLESHLALDQSFVSTDVLDPLEAALVANQDLRRNLWKARATAATNVEGVHRLWSSRLGAAREEDFGWLWGLRVSTSNEQVKGAIASVLRVLLRKMSPEQRAQLLGSSESADLTGFIEQAESADAEAAAAQRERDAREASEKEELRAKNVAELEPRKAEIEAGDNGQALVWAWNHLTDTKGHRSRLGTARLIELVGSDIAESFLTGFQRWWRRHEPTLQPPGNNSVPLVDLAGLTGLSLEIERGLTLGDLSDAEIERAVRYALHELNGFPVWFDALRAAHPPQVRAVLKQVVHAEWAAPIEHHGIISRAPYEPAGTATLLRELVLDEVEYEAPGHVRTIHQAIGALLVAIENDHTVATALRRHVHNAAGADDQALVEWLRGWSHFAPVDAAKWLRALATSDHSRFLEIVARLAALLEDDFNGRGRPIPTTTWTPTALESWIRMLHVAVRPEDDIDHGDKSAYTPSTRDRAQDFRNRCISRLATDPSRQAFEALRRIRASKDMKQYLAMTDRSIQAQLIAAAEDLATAWREDDVLGVERGDERPPRTNADLFALVLRHLDRVADLLENDDFSYAELFDEKAAENDVQRWIASSLKLVSRGLYTVEREPEVQNDKLIDISIAAPGIGRVPVEIKPLYAGRYTYRQLEEFVSQQLVGRYMKPSAVDRGIFLLVPLKSRTWRVGNRTLSFDQVQERLSAHAQKVGRRAYKEVVVASINVAGARSSKARAQ